MAHFPAYLIIWESNKHQLTKQRDLNVRDDDELRFTSHMKKATNPPVQNIVPKANTRVCFEILKFWRMIFDSPNIMTSLSVAIVCWHAALSLWLERHCLPWS